MIITKFVTVVMLAYLLGSVPFGVLIGKRTAKLDVREYGSGKMGATNVLRVAGKKAAVAVAVIDVLKGTIAVLLAAYIFRGQYQVVRGSVPWWLIRSSPVAAGLAAMAGHNWSIFLKFRGGRGVATFFGGLIALCPAVGLFGGELLIVGAGLTGFASAGSLAGAVGAYSILVPLTIMNGFPIEYLAYALIGAITIIFMHRDNIARLISGKERKIGDKGEKIDSPPSEESTG